MRPLTTIVLPKNSGFQIGDDVAVGDVGPGEAVEERAAGRVEERAVGVEGAVLDRERDLVVLPSRRIAERRRRARQHAGPGRSRGTAAQEVEAGRPGVDVQPGHAQRVVVVPEGRRPLVVRVLEDGRPGRPRPAPTAPGELRPERVVARCRSVAKPPGMLLRRRQVPGLGEAVALLGVCAAVQVGDDRHRAGVRPGRRA